MASICLYFQVHQPHHLRRYSVFDSEPTYFDHERDQRLIGEMADICYLPVTRLLLQIVERFDGLFRFAFSLSGCVITQLKQYCPEMIVLLDKLNATGCIEFLGETYDHSLTYLYSRDEFQAQVERHTKLMQDLFGQTPRVFRNTELIYNNELASQVNTLGPFNGIMVAGADHVLGDRSPNRLYRAPGARNVKLLVNNRQLSDDIAVHFGNPQWPEYPLTAEKFAHWIDLNNRGGNVCNLFMAYETLQLEGRPEAAILNFFSELPAAVLSDGKNDFKLPSECVEAYQAIDSYDVPHMISWAQNEQDLSAWLGNAMQSNALHELYKLEPAIKDSDNPQLLVDWRRLTTSDHFYYMSTKYFSDGEAHQGLTPYESPYDAYINFMNVLDNLRFRANQAVSRELQVG